MPGGGKGGSAPSGNTTTTTINPTQQAQLPFLEGQTPNAGWNQAATLAQFDPLQYYPGQTLANFNPFVGQGFSNQIGQADFNQNNLVPAGNISFLNAVNGGLGVGNSPAFGALSSAAGGAMGVGNSPATPGLAGIGGGNSAPQALLNNESANLNDLGLNSASAGQEFGNEIHDYLNQGSGVGNNIAALGNYGTEAAGAGLQIGDELASVANGSINGLPSAYGLLGNAGATAGQPNIGTGLLTRATQAAGQPNLATATLGNEAAGAFLGSNPYLAGEFNAAAQPVTNAYMTATAPQTDSNFEASGRYGSGALGSARSINEQNLGTTLGNMGSNLYGQDYANERGLMTSAQGTLGSLINQGIGLEQAGGSSLGSLINQGNQLQQSAGNSLGSLGLGEFGARTNALTAAGNQYQTGLGQGINAQNSAGNLAISNLGQQLQGIQNAANDYFTGQGQAANAYGAAGGLGAQNLGAMNSALSQLQSGYNVGNANTLAGASGLQSGYQSGNLATLAGLGMEPSVLNSSMSPSQQMTAGGQGLTSMNQAQITDAMNRFYGQEQAPYQSLTQYMNLIGQPTSGSSQTTQPFFQNQTANALGTLTGGLGLLNGANSAFGSGGLFSGLFGGGAASGIGTVDSLAGEAGASSLASLGLEAPSAGGDILSAFLPFLGLA